MGIKNSTFKAFEKKQDLGVKALSYQTPLKRNFDWQVNLIAINLSTAVSRNVSVSIRRKGIDYKIVNQTAWSGQDIVVTDELKLNAEDEIIIRANKTSGILNLYISYEQVGR